jgi:site-specific DNA-adenine methylase
MFYYYGRKKQIAKNYPSPIFDTVIEPFAGSAAYALHGDNWKRNVILIEKDIRVAEIWQWLIGKATPEEILSLPILKAGERSSEFLHIIHAATKMAFKYKTIKVTPVLERNWEISKRVMAANVHKVKHWEIICGDYSMAPNIEATWFIDPPYKSDPGLGYAHGSDKLDYEELAGWVSQRKGQLMCCEGKSGDYLPFVPLLKMPGVAGKISQEVMYYRYTGPVVQEDLFRSQMEVA